MIRKNAVRTAFRHARFDGMHWYDQGWPKPYLRIAQCTRAILLSEKFCARSSLTVCGSGQP